MALRPVEPGLRKMYVNDSHEVVRVELRVPAGAFLEVDDDTAAQFPPSIKDAAVVEARDAARGKAAAKAEKKAAKEDAAEAESEG
jgi:hypothetical protein